MGWIFRPKRATADYSTVQDLTQYPELVWLDRYHLVPAVALGVACFLVGGAPGLFVGFFLSTVILYHCTFFINSLAHVAGTQRYITGDDSRNNFWLALITLGEGWHNNHHHYQSATAQGWRWYEIDITYYVLKALSWTGLVWEMRTPPAEVVNNERPLGRKTMERVARELAASFPTERLAAQLRETWEGLPGLTDITARAAAIVDEAPTRDEIAVAVRELKEEAGRLLSEINLPSLPSTDELKARARDTYADSPSLDEIAERARQLLAEAISLHFLEEALQGAV